VASLLSVHALALLPQGVLYDRYLESLLVPISYFSRIQYMDTPFITSEGFSRFGSVR
jgi:hypothetical protein